MVLGVTVIVVALFSFAMVATRPSSAERREPRNIVPLTQASVTLRLDMRRLWEDQLLYTRNYIISSLAGLPDVEAAASRLLRIQDEIGNILAPFYGEEAGRKFALLLRDHNRIATEVVGSARAGKGDDLARTQARWAANADDMAGFLSGANPYWDKARLVEMLYKHLDFTTQEVVARLKMDWPKDIGAFDAGHVHVLRLADELASGLAAQFPDSFNEFLR